jgi:RNA polymerase sigma-70 factor (ECF subfamily)
MIIKYVYKQVNSVEDAKDLTQEIFMKVHKYFHKYDPNKASLKTWLFTITNNHVINFYKRKANKVHFYDGYDFTKLASDEDILEALIQDDDINYIKSLMHQVLNKKHEKVMTLFFFGDLSQKEIARIVKLSPKTIRNIIALSINKLKAKLEEKS